MAKGISKEPTEILSVNRFESDLSVSEVETVFLKGFLTVFENTLAPSENKFHF